jgi:hypothetical protein
MFIPRHPVVENQFCVYGDQTGTGTAGVGGVVCYAGAAVYLYTSATNQEPVVYKVAHDSLSPVFGFAMQKVKTGYHQVHPTGFMMPGDLGSSDVIAQPDYDANGAIQGTKEAPLGVSHLGIWDTVHYTCKKTYSGTWPNGTSTIDGTLKMTPGRPLYAAADEGKLTTSTANSDGSNDVEQGDRANLSAAQIVATCMKGVSDAKAVANIDNTTLYPIRVKLLV